MKLLRTINSTNAGILEAENELLKKVAMHSIQATLWTVILHPSACLSIGRSVGMSARRSGQFLSSAPRTSTPQERSMHSHIAHTTLWIMGLYSSVCLSMDGSVGMSSRRSGGFFPRGRERAQLKNVRCIHIFYITALWIMVLYSSACLSIRRSVGMSSRRSSGFFPRGRGLAAEKGSIHIRPILPTALWIVDLYSSLCLSIGRSVG